MSIFNKAENARRIMRDNIERDPVGARLTDAAKERAVDFAVKTWKGDMGNGQAAQIGIQHVTADILRK
jgi:hypothetical protein